MMANLDAAEESALSLPDEDEHNILSAIQKLEKEAQH